MKLVDFTETMNIIEEVTGDKIIFLSLGNVVAIHRILEENKYSSMFEDIAYYFITEMVKEAYAFKTKQLNDEYETNNDFPF